MLFAQPDNQQDFYWYNRSLRIDRIEREHFPLDGDAVTMIPFRQDSLFGFVQKEAPHEWLLEPQYRQVLSVHEQGAVVMHENGYYGLVNEKGSWLIEPFCDQIFKENDLYHGMLFGVMDTLPDLDEMYNSAILNYYVNEAGEKLFMEMAHNLVSFNAVDTLAWFRKGTNYRIRGKSGQLWKEFEHDSAKEFVGINNNRLIFRQRTTDDWDYEYTYTGYNLADEAEFSFTCRADLEAIIELSPGFFATSSSENDWGFRNAKGEEYLYEYSMDEITYLYQGPDIYSMDYFPVIRPYGHGFNRQMGLIDRTGKEIIPIIYRYVDEPVDGVSFRLSHEENGFSQFVDTSGKIIVDKVFAGDGLLEVFQSYGKPVGFYDGLLPTVGLSGRSIGAMERYPEYPLSESDFRPVYLNAKLEQAVELDTGFMFLGLFSEGLAPVVNNQKELGFIDKTGKMAIAPAYSLSVAGGYPIPYLVIPEFKGGFAYIKAFKGYIDRTGKAFFAGEQLRDHYDFSH